MKKVCSVFILIAIIFSNITCFAEENDKTETETEDTVTYIRGNHPRKNDLWLQYFPLSTALRKNVVISDVITPEDEWETWDGTVVNTHNKEDENAENYDDSHNHYQNILSEVLNFSEGTNAVAIWGDSSAVVDGSKAWGGFFSARSNAKQFLNNKEFSEYIPEGVDLNYEEDSYDTQLIGIEVDVLNDSLPGVYPNMSKTGVQIVGFGNPNSMAIEVRSEDSDKNIENEEDRRGSFESGLYFKNSIAPYGRLIVSDLQQARIGLDLKNTLFTEGALQIQSQQVGTGIIYNNGESGEIYGGTRWSDTEDQNDWLTLRAGNGGLRIVSNDNTQELMVMDNYGGVYLNNDIYINGRKLDEYITEANRVPDNIIYILCAINIFWLIIISSIVVYLKKIRNADIIRLDEKH